jgi:hypothetical protein
MPEENTGLENQGSSDNGGTSENNETILTIDKWREALPEDLATDKSMADIKDLEGLAKSYIHAQKMIGTDKVPVPREDWTDSDWDNFYNKLGRPESPEQYDLEKPEELPEGMSFNEEYEEEFKKQAHKRGLSKAQANKMWKFLQDKSIENYSSAVESRKQANQEGWENLRKEWGKAFDSNVKLSEKVAAVAGPEFTEWAKKVGLWGEPQMVAFGAKIGKMLSEDSIGKTETRTSPVFSPREITFKDK